MEVEFRVLGPVEAHRGDTFLRLGAPKQRTVLALLLLHPNQPVTVSRVVDELWPHNAPSSATANTISYLSGLRRVLADAGCTLERRTVGYVLHVLPESIDLRRFLSHTERGEAAWSAGEPAAAEQHWRQALATWRGHAFDGLPTGPELNAARAHLDERRLAVLERHARARLRLGDHAGVVGELRRHVLAEPLRETGWLLLMAACWFGGNPADALETYERARAVLAEQLGVDPGSRLRAMHQAVLTGADDDAWALLDDTAHRPDARTEPAPLSPTPAQLPLDIRGFTGRADQLARLDAALDSTATQPTAVVISAVSGTAGVGKTALALHWAHLRADRFPDGQLYANLRGFDPDAAAADPAKVVRRFLDALGVPASRIPADPDAQTALYRSRIAGRRMLVVLDNGRNTEQVRALLPGSRQCMVLVTSRNQLADLVALDGAQPLVLDVLDRVEARQLLASRLGAGPVAAEPAAVEEIITRCARLPLALGIVAARAATNPQLPLGTLAEQLRDEHGTLDALAGESPSADVRSVFSWSFRQLGPDPARLFRLLGRHPGTDIGVLAAASLAGVTAAAVRPTLAELTRANLLTEHVPGRYTCHDLLRVYATELARAHDSDTDTALHRVLDHYLHTAHAAAMLIAPQREQVPLDPPAAGSTPQPLTTGEQALAWLATERATLVAVVELAAERGFDGHTRQLAWALTVYFARRGHPQDWAATQRAALRAATRVGDRAGQADAHRALLRAYSRIGMHTEAQTHFQQALRVYSELGDTTGQAHCHNNMAYALSLRGRQREALQHNRSALDLYRAAGNLMGQADALNSLGWVHSLLGEHQQTLRYSGQALALLRQIDAPTREANSLDSLGHAHHHLGDHHRAIACYIEAIGLARTGGDRHTEVDALTHLGDTYHAIGRSDAARTSWQEALSIMAEMDHPDTAAVEAKLHALVIPQPAV